MQTRKGIPVSPGVAISRAVVLDTDEEAIPKRALPAEKLPAEHDRLAQAITASMDELRGLHEETASVLGDQLADIFSFHLGMLADKTLTARIDAVIEGERVTAEYAVYIVMQDLADQFLGQDNAFFRERVVDIYDLKRRLLQHLVGERGSVLDSIDQPAVIFAHDLTPSQTASLDRKRIRAIATDVGGRTSHTAILAHALGIPAIVGLKDITRRVTNGQQVILDGNRGLVHIEPNADQLLEYRQEARVLREQARVLRKLRDEPAVTTDGTEIKLLANIEFAEEIPQALEFGASGVGLYRTEFLFMGADHEPTEEEQYEAYATAIKLLDGRPMTIRTLDLGADKIAPGVAQLHNYHEYNPFLGCRSIRLCLQHLDLFRTQLRAILRASALGPIQIMFPLISNIMELRQAKMILGDVREDLEDQGYELGNDVPVGMMMEVPSAALQATAFAKEVDFFSIGTNDLIQYTVAVDRSNERIANLYSGAHPAVLSLVKEIVRAANRSKIGVSLCGEMGGEPEFTMLLLGLGLRTLSISPPAIPEIKQLTRTVGIERCKRVARKAGGFDSDREVYNYLRDEMNKLMPGTFTGRSMNY
ncbi:MAG: phosphoenolpyruvate--protein phosphotransferase [Phycisphaerales bacterium JB063]